MAPELVGRRVAAVRQALNASKRAFADLVGTDHSTLSKIENGERDLPRDIGIMIQVQTGIPIGYLFLGEKHGLPSDPENRFFALRSTD